MGSMGAISAKRLWLRRGRCQLSVALLVVSAWLVLSALAFPRPAWGAASDGFTLVELDKPWEFIWGDSPRDLHGRLLYAQALPQPETGWQPVRRTVNPPGRHGQRFLWLRTRLEGPSLIDP